MDLGERLIMTSSRNAGTAAKNGTMDREYTTATRPSMTRHRVQLIVFLLVLPAVNLLFASAFLHDVGMFSAGAVTRAGVRMWFVFGLSFLALRIAERVAPRALSPDHFLRQLIVHFVVIAGVGALMPSLIEMPATIERPISLIMPRVFILLQIIIYLTVVRIFHQQARQYEAAVMLRESRLAVLRSQSNPHFLFNTLNLIASEISTDPANAREIVFDLADLLRSNLKMAERRITTISEEMRLVSLYLTLQQKRFKDRLETCMEIDERAKPLPIPALLLQPVVENTVKWAVAPHSSAARVRVACTVTGDRLQIVFHDSGPPFDDGNVVEGNGFRILRQTLHLHYGDDFEMSLKSTTSGGLFTLVIPAHLTEHVDA